MSETKNPNRIIERIYLKGEYRLTSPLMMGSGEDTNTDMDILKDALGNVFIPGTAIAGTIRSYLAGGQKKEDETLRHLFGERDKESTQSLIYVSNATIKNNPNVRSRDGVALELDTKTAKDKAKYNYEIVEPGAAFDMRFEVAFRAKHKDIIPTCKGYLVRMLAALQDGDIAFGAKTRRGFGKGQIETLQILDLNLESSDRKMIETWLTFDWNTMPDVTLKQVQERWELETIALVSSDKENRIEVEFTLPYSLLIRDYLSNPNEPDAIHLRSGENPIIPGTSWAGAIKHQMKRICAELGMKPILRNKETTYPIIEELFGFVDIDAKKPKNKAKASRITFDESVIQNAKTLNYTRNKIDRFTGGTVTGALFEEQPVFGDKQATIPLRITIKKPEDSHMEDAEIGLLLLALQDLWHGIQAIGGETSVGRGILQGKRLKINGREFDPNNHADKTYQRYMQALSRKISDVISSPEKGKEA